jgi:hypothetical protein
MLDAMNHYREQLLALRGYNTRDVVEFRRQLRQDLGVWAKELVSDVPQAEMFYNRVVLPELTLTSEEVEELMAGGN